ncbi:DUF397 domain-containing protein [Streptomyces sp. NPDC002537]
MTSKPDLSIAKWRKSQRSVQGDSCLEIAEQYSDVMPVRDSKDKNRTPVVVPRAAWAQFVTAVAATHGDLSA